MKEFIIDRQPWRHWPRVLVVRKIDGTPNIEERRYVPERTTTRNTKRTVYGNPRPVCEVCGFGIGDKRWGYCPKCGAKIIGG